ncbi:MerR family transcriptional regulator, partial [Bacillus subtilis]|uniref:MerR family transcriptional regulator n=1 Tax=Bacillus subtilis TaxID=1423 RepID=UPI00338EF7DA
MHQLPKTTRLTKRTIPFYQQIPFIPPPKPTHRPLTLYSHHHIHHLHKLITTKHLLAFSLHDLHHFIQTTPHLHL